MPVKGITAANGGCNEAKRQPLAAFS